MRGWNNGYGDTEFYTEVYDENHRESLLLALDKDGKLTVQMDGGVKLDGKGIENLRKKLQQVEYFRKERGV